MIERAAAYAFRVKSRGIAIESKKVRTIPGSAQRSLRDACVLYVNDSCSVGQPVTLAATGMLDIFTVVLGLCPPVAAANIQGMFGDNPHCFVSIAEDPSLLSGVVNRH